MSVATEIQQADRPPVLQVNDCGLSLEQVQLPVPQHLLTIALEDYFQVGAFHRLIPSDQWYRFETRLAHNTEMALELLGRHGIKATFFVLGWNAERWPELIRQIAEAGHEIASGGYLHRNIATMSPAEFREDLARTRELLEAASGKRVVGYRLPDGWLRPQDLWALDVLAEEGYAYDSSLLPKFREFSKEPERALPHSHTTAYGPIDEFPPATFRVCGLNLPIAGGNYLRQLPHALMSKLVAQWHRRHAAPFVMYFNVWELDAEQPQISAAGSLARIRHYRNLGKMQRVLEQYFQQYTFGSIADYLKLDRELSAAEREKNKVSAAEKVHMQPRSSSAMATEPDNSRNRHTRLPVSIVIPCYNEERSLPYLCNTLESVEARLSDRYEPHFLFVDDCSSDATLEALHAIFGSKTNCRVLHHEVNQGVAAAILTGIQAADSEIVCSMDCDCTYDPHELEHMIPLLTEDVDLVTASPYHPQGHVQNVPAWRLSLSWGSSFLYRQVLGCPLHTFTSCFRVYRRSAVMELSLTEPNFLGIAELLGKLALNGSRIVEHPATLAVRIFGQSKMKVVRTILGHLKLLGSLLKTRLSGKTLTKKPLTNKAASTVPVVTEEQPLS